MGKEFTYKSFNEVILLVAKENGHTLPEGLSNEVLLNRINDSSMERDIYLRAINELKVLWLSDTIKIDIEEKFIYDSLLKHVGWIRRGLGNFLRKYTENPKGIKEAQFAMRNFQDKLVMLHQLPKMEIDEVRRKEKWLKAFNEGEDSLIEAYDQMEVPKEE